MAQSPDQILIAPEGEIYVAPVGTAAPTTESSSLNALFKELGLVSEDAVTLRMGTNVERIRAWQLFQAARSVITSQDMQVEFALMEWSDLTLPVAFGGGSVVEETTGHFHFEFPGPAEGLTEYALVIDWHDGDKDYRFHAPRVTLAEGVEMQLSRTAAALLPLTFDVLGSEAGTSAAEIFSNDVHLGVAS